MFMLFLTLSYHVKFSEAPVVTGTCPENEILEGTDLLLECTATGIWETAVW